MASLLVGSSATLTSRQVIHYLAHPDASYESYVVNTLRMQRTLIGLLVGTALAVAGAVMQAVTRNPLAEPGLLGVNAGASLAVVVGTAALGAVSVPGQLVLAACGALVATVVVHLIGSVGGVSTSPARLVLIGVAFSASASAFIQGIVLRNDSAFAFFRYWEVGSLTRTDIPLALVAIPVVVGVACAAIASPGLDNLSLGDDVAAALGTDVTRLRVLSLVTLTLLCGTATTVAGPIAFVGLMVPLTASWLMGPHRGWIVALCAVGGPCLVLAADVLGRILARPGEMQVGLLTAFVGSPVLLLMVLRMKDRTS